MSLLAQTASKITNVCYRCFSLSQRFKIARSVFQGARERHWSNEASLNFADFMRFLPQTAPPLDHSDLLLALTSIKLNFDVPDYLLPKGDDFNIDDKYDARLKDPEIIHCLQEALGHLNTSGPEDKAEIIKALNETRRKIVIENGILDNALMQALPQIASDLPGKANFSEALKIESHFARLTAQSEVVFCWEVYCTADMSRPVISHGQTEAPVMKHPVFFLYRNLFPDRGQLAAFVRELGRLLDQKPQLAQEITAPANFMAFIRENFNIPLKKGFVLDGDGVLWDGIIDEVGPNGIKVSPPYQEFQRFLQKLKNAGFLLSICSKNKAADIQEVLRRQDMILKTEDFVQIQTNWRNKSDNLKTIAENLNIGLNSLVFLDDNPHERALVRISCPEVFTPEIPADPASWPNFLEDLGLFSIQNVTEEDRRRTEYYLTDVKRQAEREKFETEEEYFSSLGLKLSVKEGKANSQVITRLVKLTQRTNHFNLTGSRLSEEKIRNYCDSSSNYVFSCRLSDKFGELDTVGLIILEKSPHLENIADILTFCFSCRVLKFNPESAFLNYVAKQLKAKGFGELRLSYEFSSAASDSDSKDICTRLGFIRKYVLDFSAISWRKDLKDPPLPVPWIDIMT